MFYTGVTACDLLKEVCFSGNIIPQIWYKVFVKKDLKYPKPHLLAINILSDIVYWYRPTEVRDETTGQLIGYRKKFNSDLLQRNYNQLAEMFGCSNGQAKDAVVFLESTGVIRRVFRDMEIGGIFCNNILFIALDVERLKELTYPSGEICPEGVCGNFTGGVAEFPHRGEEITTEGILKFQRTNTENTTKNSPEITPSIHPRDMAQPEQAPEENSDGLMDGDIQYAVEEEIDDEGGIPYVYKNNSVKMEFALEHFMSYDVMANAPEKTDFQKNALTLLLECLVEMACTDKIETYKGSTVSYAKVIDRLNECIRRDGWLNEFADEAIDDYILAASKKEIRDKKKYMKAVIWNSLSTYKVKFDSFFARTYLNADDM